MGWINVLVDEATHKRAKVKAAEEGKKLEEIVNEALSEYCAREEKKGEGNG